MPGSCTASPLRTSAERLKALGIPEADETFWNAVRPNLETFKDVELWARIVHGPITPVLEDADYLRQAAGLLPPEPWNEQTWPAWTAAIKEKTGRKGKPLFHPLRLALTGLDHGPEMKHLLPLIGRERAKARLALNQR